MNSLWQSILIYSVLQLINVFLSTIRNVATIKWSRWLASVLNAIYFGFYTIIIVYTVSGDLDLWAKVLITAITNLIGVYAGRIVTDKFKKNKVWDIMAILKSGELVKALLAEENLVFVYNMGNDGSYIFHIYTNNKEESRKVRKILADYDAKITVHEENAVL